MHIVFRDVLSLGLWWTSKSVIFVVAFGVRRNVLNNSATSDASLYGWLFLSILMVDSLVFGVLIKFRPYSLNSGRQPLRRLIICYYFCSISWIFFASRPWALSLRNFHGTLWLTICVCMNFITVSVLLLAAIFADGNREKRSTSTRMHKSLLLSSSNGPAKPN